MFDVLVSRGKGLEQLIHINGSIELTMYGERYISSSDHGPVAHSPVGPQQDRHVFTLQTLPACNEPSTGEVRSPDSRLHAGVVARDAHFHTDRRAGAVCRRLVLRPFRQD
ncbi:MAG: hypothetical protein ACH254_21835 [Candidatus Thiodiazotropha endolucinida]